MSLKFTDFERKFLVACYLVSESSSDEIITTRVVLDKYALEPQAGWLRKALEGFIDEGLAKDTATHDGDLDQSVWLTAAGYRRAEELLPHVELTDTSLPSGVSRASGNIFIAEGNLPTDFGSDGDIALSINPGGPAQASTAHSSTTLEIPAADRIVTIDHNSEPVKAIRAASAALVQKIRTGNDLGELTPEEAQVAANEVFQLGQLFGAETVRQNTVLAYAKRVLLFVVSKTAGTAVGQAGWALLVLIAAYFGIQLT